MVERWAEIVIERWIKRIKELDVVDTGALLKSLQAHFYVDANGDPQKITFLYLYYGIFPELGVGRGVHLSDHSDARERKPWYSSVFITQVRKLGWLMARRYGIDAAKTPVRAFEGMKHDENFNEGWTQIK